jgi:hypothetical protein
MEKPTETVETQQTKVEGRGYLQSHCILVIKIEKLRRNLKKARNSQYHSRMHAKGQSIKCRKYRKENRWLKEKVRALKEKLKQVRRARRG